MADDHPLDTPDSVHYQPVMDDGSAMALSHPPFSPSLSLHLSDARTPATRVRPSRFVRIGQAARDARRLIFAKLVRQSLPSAGQPRLSYAGQAARPDKEAKQRAEMNPIPAVLTDHLGRMEPCGSFERPIGSSQRAMGPRLSAHHFPGWAMVDYSETFFGKPPA